ncbi:hypothetical protein V6O07_10465 [Arthrospira platensis SPKY2]
MVETKKHMEGIKCEIQTDTQKNSDSESILNKNKIGTQDIIDKRDYKISNLRIPGVEGIIYITPKKLKGKNWSFHIQITWDDPNSVREKKEQSSISSYNEIYRYIHNLNPFGSEFLPKYLDSYIILQGCGKTTGIIILGDNKNSNKISKCYRIIYISKDKKLWKILAPNGIILDWKRGEGATLLNNLINIKDNKTDILYFLLDNWKQINVQYGLIEKIILDEETHYISFIRDNTIIKRAVYECYDILERIIQLKESSKNGQCYDTITLIAEREENQNYYYDLRVDKVYLDCKKIIEKLNQNI